MPDSLILFSVAGSGGISLTDTTNYSLASFDWGDRTIDELVFAQSSMRPGATLVLQQFAKRIVTLDIEINATAASIPGLLQTLNRNLASPPVTAELAYLPSGGSTTSYLDVVAGERPVRLDPDAPIGRKYRITLYTYPFWRTISRSAPRILQNKVKNPSFERWTAGAPDNWTAVNAPVTTQHTAWSKYGLSSLRISKAGAAASYYQDITCVAETIYALKSTVKPVSGTLRFRVNNGAGAGNAVTLGSSTGTAEQELSGLYATAVGQTTIRIFVEVLTNSDGMFDAVYCDLASNTGGAIPAEWISYTSALKNHQCTDTDHVNDLMVHNLLGDVSALAELRLTMSTLAAACDRCWLAMRVENPAYHIAWYQVETGTLNAAWGGAGGSLVTVATATPESGADNAVRLTAPAAGNVAWTWAARITLSPLAGEATTVWQKRQGRFRLLLRLRTDSLTANVAAWQLRGSLKTQTSQSAVSGAVSPSVGGSLWHFVDMGEFTIPAWQMRAASAINPLSFQVDVSLTAENNKILDMDVLLLLPMDSLSQKVKATGGGSWPATALVYTSTLELTSLAEAVDSAGLSYASAIPISDPFYLPHDGGVLNLMLEQTDNEHKESDTVAVMLSYVPQYLAPT